jgi:hypothetical protein
MSKRRIVIATLVAAIVVAVLSGEAFARRGVHHAQFGRRHLHHDVVRNDPPDDRRSARHALLRRSKISDVAGLSRRLDARRCETMSPMGSCQLGTSLSFGNSRPAQHQKRSVSTFGCPDRPDTWLEKTSDRRDVDGCGRLGLFRRYVDSNAVSRPIRTTKLAANGASALCAERGEVGIPERTRRRSSHDMRAARSNLW